MCVCFSLFYITRDIDNRIVSVDKILLHIASNNFVEST